MRIAFRVDASLAMGSGHVMRCLTLAEALCQHCHSIKPFFICREHPGHLIDLIRLRGFHVVSLPATLTSTPARSSLPSTDYGAIWLGASWQEDADAVNRLLQPHPVDWLIVDHYSLDARWENALSGGYAQLMVIDDLANRPHRCDLLLDQTLGCTPEAYQSLTPIGSTLLTGTQFAVLRPEFAHWRAESLTRRNHCDTIQRIVLSLGGADPDNITGAFLENLRTSPLPESIELVIILGAQSPWQETIAHLARTLPNPTSVLIGVSNMAEILSQSDLAIGAAGTSSWERCCLGVPTLQVVIAENQAMIARQLEQAGAVIPITLSGHRPLSEVISGVTQAQLTSLSQHAARLVDGMGAQRVANTLLDLSKIGPDYE